MVVHIEAADGAAGDEGKEMVDEIAADAEQVVDNFIFQHRAAAIPALIGACVMWAVTNGGTEVVKDTLQNAIRLADEMHAIKKATDQ